MDQDFDKNKNEKAIYFPIYLLSWIVLFFGLQLAIFLATNDVLLVLERIDTLVSRRVEPGLQYPPYWIFEWVWIGRRRQPFFVHILCGFFVRSETCPSSVTTLLTILGQVFNWQPSFWPIVKCFSINGYLILTSCCVLTEWEQSFLVCRQCLPKSFVTRPYFSKSSGLLVFEL